MDPWQPCHAKNANNTDYISSSNLTNGVGLALHNQQHNNQVQDQSSFDLPISSSTDSIEHHNQQDKLSFGDNFQPFVKLPDSQEYLASLERKLKTIQKGGRKGANAESILRSLEQSKESCMIKLLSNSVEKLTIEQEVFEELKVNPLLKKLAPEKQALTAEELVHLLKADQLELLLGNINLEEEVAGSSASAAAEVTTTEAGTLETSTKSESELEKEKDSIVVSETDSSGN